MALETPSPRETRGLAILAMGNQIKRINSTRYRVRSQSGNGWYLVVRDKLNWYCECPDLVHRHVVCKHIHAVQFSQRIRQFATLQNFGFDYQPVELDICENCGSDKLMKRGVRHNKNEDLQRYGCKNCGHRFTVRIGYDKLKHDPKLVTLSMDLYFKGISYRAIKDHIKQFSGVKVWESNIYYWVRKYIELMKEYVEKLTPNISGIWHADETMQNVRNTEPIRVGRKGEEGNYVWLWNLMDHDTRFLLASQIHKKREIRDARAVFAESKEVAQRDPALVVTDGLHAYSQAFTKEFYRRSLPRPEHVRLPSIRDRRTNNNNAERLHGMMKQRTKVMRGLDHDQSAQKYVDGFKIYYNYIRPHMALGDKTPAEKANINLHLDQNRWDSLIKQSASQKQRKGSH